MNYIERVMELVREEAWRDPGDELPADMLRFYAVLALALGEQTDGRATHHGWGGWRTATAPDHVSLVDYDELSPEVQALDEPYAAAIRRAAARWKQQRSPA